MTRRGWEVWLETFINSLGERASCLKLLGVVDEIQDTFEICFGALSQKEGRSLKDESVSSERASICFRQKENYVQKHGRTYL